tara:strand:+ start:663 stop:1526 length:864 start_codon:yes stop_codon:yes gene_type:complete
MNFSIIIPTFQNFDFLRFTIESIIKNSSNKHEIIVHINGKDGLTENYLTDNNYKFTKSERNIGLCSGVNLAAKLSTHDYILYAHDDMYFLPKWDEYLENEVNIHKHNNFYLSMTQISHTIGEKGNVQHIHFNCGDSLKNFNLDKLLKEYEKFEFRDLQGSHWAPHLIHKSVWNKVGGFSEEFNPGFASDPDLNMKLWKEGVRIFKGVSKSRLYHFGSVTTRNNKNVIPNNGKKTFLLKWKMTIEFFTKHYLRRGGIYNGPLEEPYKNFFYYKDFLISKIKFYLNRIF